MSWGAQSSIPYVSVARWAGGGLVVLLLVAMHLLALARGPAWTSPLLIGDHLFSFGFALVMLLYAHALGRRLARSLIGLSTDPLYETLAALGLGLGAFSVGTLCLGFLHLYYAAMLPIVALVLTLWLRRELAADLRAICCGTPRWGRAAVRSIPSLGQRLIALVLALLVLAMCLRTTLPVSPNVSGTDYDALAYHIAVPQIYVSAHEIVPRPDLSVADAPSGGDILLVPALLAASDTSGKALTLLCALLLGATIYATGRRLFNPAGAWLGVFIFFSTTWLTPIIPSTMPDCAAALLLALGAGDLLAWCLDQRAPAAGATAPGGRSTFRLLIRAGLLLGFAASFKYTAVPVLPAAVVLAASAVLAGRPRVGKRGTPDGMRPSPGLWTSLVSGGARTRRWDTVAPGIVRVAARFAAVEAALGLALLVPLAPWFLKNLYFFGNPLYPATVTAAPRMAHNGVGVGAVLPHESLLDHLRWMLGTLTGTTWHDITPLSLLVLVVPLVMRRPAYGFALGFCALSGLLWLEFVPFFPPPRYWMGMLAVADALVGALAWDYITGGLRRVSHLLVGAAIVLSAGLNLMVATFAAPPAIWYVWVVAGVGIVAMVLARLGRVRTCAGVTELVVTAPLVVGALAGLFIQVGAVVEQHALGVARGDISRDTYLGAYLTSYAAERYADAHLPRGAMVVLIHASPSYYLRSPYLADLYGSRFEALQAAGPAGVREQMQEWCRARVRYAIFNRGPEQPGDSTRAAPLHSFVWIRTPGLRPRVLFSAHDVDVLAVQPCAVRTYAR